MKKRDKQLQRLIIFIEEVKKGRYPNATNFEKKLRAMDRNGINDLSCSSKTIKRDVEFLKNNYNAPIDYDPANKGYFFYSEWTLPELALGGDEMFAELFTRKLAKSEVLPSLREHLNAGSDIQMALAEQGDLDPSILNSVIHATGNIIPVDESVSADILAAWKDCYEVEVLYSKGRSKEDEKRTLQIHGLFLANKVWYCRAFCHDRQDYRNFSLHRIQKTNNLKKKFKRSKAVIDSLQKREFFGLEKVANVKVRCAAEVSDYIHEREWFATAQIEDLSNGDLEITFLEVPRQMFNWWVASFSGLVEIVEPHELRQEIYSAGQKLMERHSD